MDINARTVDALKAAGHYFAAGALAHSLGMGMDSYGCHFGMRSEIEYARDAYKRGWIAYQ